MCAGVNGFLVRVCLEYLGKEVALKEEGIFRVPGDSSIVRSLHSDFLSGRATREFLRSVPHQPSAPGAEDTEILGLIALQSVV